MIIDNYILFRKGLYIDYDVKLISASLDITSRCNLSCIHCYQKNLRANLLENKSNIKKILKKLKMIGIEEITLSGGEPTCSPIFVDIIKMAKENDFFIRIITNGLNIRSLYQCLDILDPIYDVIQFSIDEPMFINLRQRYYSNENAIIYKNLEVLTKLYKNLIVNITPTKQNQSFITEIVKDCIIKGSKYIAATPYIPIGGVESDSIIPDYNIVREQNHLVRNLCKTKGIVYYGGIDGHICQSHLPVSNVKNVKLERAGDFAYSCDACRFNIHILSNGDVVPCSFFQNYKLDNLLYSDIQTLLKKLRMFRKNLPIIPSECQTCSCVDLCNGGCMGLIYDRYNCFGNKDPRCVGTDYD